MRWDSVDPRRYLTDQARLFVRNHTVTPTIDRTTWRLRVFGDGLATRAPPRTRCPCPGTTCARCRGPRTSRSTSAPATAAASTPRQQGQTVSGTSWKLGAVGAVVWEGVRLRDLLEARRPLARRRLDPGDRPGPELRDGRGRLRAGPPPVPGQQGARRRDPGLGRQRQAAAARPRLPAAPGPARLGRHRQHQVARLPRGLDDRAHLAVEHQVVPAQRWRLPGGLAAAHGQPGPVGLGAAVRRHAAPRAADAHRPVLERRRADPAGRGQPRRRRHLEEGPAEGRGPGPRHRRGPRPRLVAVVGQGKLPQPGVPRSSSPAPPTAPAGHSR